MKIFLCFLALGTILIVGSVSVIEGQVPLQPSWQSQAVTDQSCYYDGTNCGLGTTNCAAETFTVDTSGTYYLHAWMQCFPNDPNNCGGCYACAHLVRLPTGDDMYPGGLHTSPGNCDLTSPGITLQAGAVYRLSVCKKPYGSSDCSVCDVECRANAQVHN